jgi:RNA polymerase sigma-70 factor (ECF subfamily)
MADLVHVDRALARRILRGDEAAFRDLFDRFFPRLYRFALARLPGDPDGARDIVQQTFCHAIERLDTYRGEAALLTWLCTFCRHEIAAHHARLGRFPTVDLPEDGREAAAARDSRQAEHGHGRRV